MPSSDLIAPPTNRWISEPAMGAVVEALDAELAQRCAQAASQPQIDWFKKAHDIQKWTKIGAAVAIALVCLPMGLNLLRSDSQLTLGMIGRMAGIIAVLGAISYFGFGKLHGVRALRLGLRDRALKALARENTSLRVGGFAHLTGDAVGSLPWLATELDTVVECDLYGTYRGHRIAVLRCTYVVDRGLTALEASTGKLAAEVMSHVQHEGVRRTELEAIVFLDGASDLPDLFWAAKKQPLNWYFKKAFGSEHVEIATDDAHWLASGDIQCCGEALGPETQRIFGKKANPILQVMGGQVVAITHTWDWHRPEMGLETEQIKRDLDWACALYESLGVPGSALPEPRIETRIETSIPPTTVVAPVAHARPRSFLRIVGAGFGVLLVLISGIVLLGTLAQAYQASQAANWPTVEGQIVHSSVDVREGAVPMYWAHVEYDFKVSGQAYHGNRIAIGSPKRDRQRANIEAVLAKYPVKQTVSVRYSPSKPSDSVLEPRLESEGMNRGVSIFSACLAAGGAYLIYCGIRRPSK